MGEYFAAVLLKEDMTPVGYWHPRRFGSIMTRETGGVDPVFVMGEGAKLGEHSYVGNPVPDAVCSWLELQPMRVGWLGDYTPKANVPPRFPNLVNAVHSYEELKGYWFRDLPVIEHEVHADMWLLDHSRKEAVHIPGHEPMKWIYHPLPLLTSTDGHPTCRIPPETEEYVGRWMWDLIGLSDELPEGYTDLGVDFGED